MFETLPWMPKVWYNIAINQNDRKFTNMPLGNKTIRVKLYVYMYSYSWHMLYTLDMLSPSEKGSIFVLWLNNGTYVVMYTYVCGSLRSCGWSAQISPDNVKDISKLIASFALYISLWTCEVMIKREGEIFSVRRRFTRAEV